MIEDSKSLMEAGEIYIHLYSKLAFFSVDAFFVVLSFLYLFVFSFVMN